MPIPLVVTKRYEGQRVTSWWQPATQTNRDPIATKHHAALQAVAPTDIKTVHQTPLLHIESNLDPLGMLWPTHDQRSQQKNWKITLQPVLINKSKFLKVTHCSEIRKIKIPRSMVVEALSWWSRRASQHPAVQSPVQPWKRPTNLARSPLLVSPRRKKNDRGQTSAFSSETSRFKPVVLAHRGSAFPWFVDDRAALRLRRIWCVPTR